MICKMIDLSLIFRTYIYNVLDETLYDIKKNRRFDRLIVEVENIANTIEQDRALQIEYEIWSDLVEQLQDLIASQNAKNEEEMKECTELARNADIEADNSIFLNSSKLGVRLFKAHMICCKYIEKIY